MHSLSDPPKAGGGSLSLPAGLPGTSRASGLLLWDGYGLWVRIPVHPLSGTSWTDLPGPHPPLDSNVTQIWTCLWLRSLPVPDPEPPKQMPLSGWQQKLWVCSMF